jgi:hypothetical protein
VAFSGFFAPEKVEYNRKDHESGKVLKVYRVIGSIDHAHHVESTYHRNDLLLPVNVHGFLAWLTSQTRIAASCESA